jgi:hypothetical protein
MDYSLYDLVYYFYQFYQFYQLFYYYNRAALFSGHTDGGKW